MSFLDTTTAMSLHLSLSGLIRASWTPFYLTRFCLSLKFTSMSIKQSTGTTRYCVSGMNRHHDGHDGRLTHPPCFALVLYCLLGVWNSPFHVIHRVLHVILYTVDHLSLTAHTQYDEQDRGGGSGEEGRKRTGKREKERGILDSSCGLIKALLTTLLVFCTLRAALVSSLAFSTYSWALRTFDSMLFRSPPCRTICRWWEIETHDGI